MAAQFFIWLCWLFWAAMYSSLFLFYLFCNFNSILSTNKVVVVVGGGGGGGGALDKAFSSRI